MTYSITMGAAVPFRSLQRAIHRACQNVQVVLLDSPELLKAFPEATGVTFVVLRPPCPSMDLPRSCADDQDFVRVRHTPTAALRKIISDVTRAFGQTRLLVHRDSTWRICPTGSRTETMTLAGFLRSGKVLQEDTPLNIKLPRERRVLTRQPA